ncbi:hypothetical protein ERJ75_000999600 [Trypanosoma vivax]|nr:hypothetical protein ERJ75_000999600 [Trypanosoma vivax]
MPGQFALALSMCVLCSALTCMGDIDMGQGGIEALVCEIAERMLVSEVVAFALDEEIENVLSDFAATREAIEKVNQRVGEVLLRIKSSSTGSASSAAAVGAIRRRVEGVVRLIEEAEIAALDARTRSASTWYATGWRMIHDANNNEDIFNNVLLEWRCKEVCPATLLESTTSVSITKLWKRLAAGAPYGSDFYLASRVVVGRARVTSRGIAELEGAASVMRSFARSLPEWRKAAHDGATEAEDIASRLERSG